MVTKKELFIERDEITNSINLLIENLTTIKDDTGEFLLEFNGIKVDDKSWTVWNWPQGVGLYGIFKYWKLTKDEKVLDIIMSWYNNRLEEGTPPKNVNTMAPLLTMAFLYEEFEDQRFLPHLKEWAEWAMYEMPRTTYGGMSHMTYEDDHKEQLWDDTLMMTVLPLAKIGMLLDIPEYVEEAKKQFLIHIQYLADKKTGLWYHGWTFEGNHNYAEALWGRGNSWISIAIPEFIDILGLTQGDSYREYLLMVLNRQIETLAKLQSNSGLWHTLLTDDNSYLESSATAGIAYGFIKSINESYIEQDYMEVVEKAINGLLKQIDENGSVQNVSIGTGMGDDLNFYKEIGITTMPYGQSLTVLALAELLITYA